jgi:hypothetical protein
VDITVVWGEFKWLGEAKIYRDNSVLMDGFRQLATRYATVNSSGNSFGGYLIYNFRADTLTLLNDYKLKSEAKFKTEFTDFSITDSDEDMLQFSTKHRDKATGLYYCVQHIPFSFFFEPNDKSARNSQSSASENASKRLSQLNKRRG